MTAGSTEAIEWKVEPDTVDEDGFVSLWNIASATCGGDVAQTREMAARLLGFLCKRQCDFVVVSTTTAEYLDERFERDNKLLYDWKPDSESVDVLAQHAEVPFEAFRIFMETRKFKPDGNYSPRRADRVEWFQEMWNVG